MPVGRWVMRTAESAVLTPWPPGAEGRKTGARMDREDRRLGVVGAGHHDLQLELVEIFTEARDLGGDLGVEAPVVRLGRKLEEHGEVLGAGDQLLQPTDVPAELRALPDEVLGAAGGPPGRRVRPPRAHDGRPVLDGA